jgi:hypothetical protein
MAPSPGLLLKRQTYGLYPWRMSPEPIVLPPDFVAPESGDESGLEFVAKLLEHSCWRLLGPLSDLEGMGAALETAERRSRRHARGLLCPSLAEMAEVSCKIKVASFTMEC